MQTKIMMMCGIVVLAVIGATLAALPTLADAQPVQGGLTRAQVKANLAQLESVGFHPGARDPHYPGNIQAAEARLHARDEMKSSAGGSAMGAMQSGKAVTATIVPTVETRGASLYRHH